MSRLDTFRELIEGYSYMKWELKWYDNERKWIHNEMSKPIECSYNKWNSDSLEYEYSYNNYEKITIGTTIPPETTENNETSFVPMPVEMRGITLRQLRAIKANADRRCAEEEWVDWENNPVEPKNVNLYDIDKYIIKPFTEITQTSLVEALPSTAGTQPPRFFISHWWGESFNHTLDCIAQMVEDFERNYKEEDDKRGGGMTDDTPVWICAFANNQWRLDQAISINPMDSSFAKAMKQACFRTVSILDKNGTVFTRIWCIEEVYLTLILAKKSMIGNDAVWAIYTAHNHYSEEYGGDRKAVGIVSGGVPYESGYQTNNREQHFPSNLILHSINIEVQSAKASEENDRVHILNSIIGNENGLEAEPPEIHPKYDKLNDAVRGAFAASPAALQAALAAGEDEWNNMLVTLSKGIQTDSIKFDFKYQGNEDDPWFHLTPSKARNMFMNLPITCSSLEIVNSEGELAEGVFDGLVHWLGKAEDLIELVYGCNKPYDSENIQTFWKRLAHALKDSRSVEKIQRIYIAGDDEEEFRGDIAPENISLWVNALEQMKALQTLDIYNMSISEEVKAVLRKSTHAPNFYVNK